MFLTPEQIKQYLSKHSLNYKRTTFVGYKRYMKDYLSDKLQQEKKKMFEKNISPSNQIKEATKFDVLNETGKDIGLYIDAKIFNTIISKHLGFVITDTKPIKYPVNAYVTKLLSSYLTKVPKVSVKKIVSDILLNSDIGIVLTASHIFPPYIGVKVDIIPSNIVVKGYFLEVSDTELFSKFMQTFLSNQKFNEKEVQKIYEEKIFKELEVRVPDYIYGLYFEYIVYILTEKYPKVYVDLVLFAKVVRAISKLIIDLFAKRYSTGKVDENALNLAVAWTLGSKYLGVRNPKLFMSSIAKVLGIDEKEFNRIMSEFEELKYTQYSGFFMLPIFLKNLGLFLFTSNEFMVNLLRSVGDSFKLMDKSYPHFVSALIISQYPTSFSARVFDEEIVKDIEEYVLKNYI